MSALKLPEVRFDDHARGGVGGGGRACEGCPARHVGRAFAAATILNALSNLTNHARGHATASVGPSTWWTNLKSGFEWDQNSFVVNQFGHPIQGSTYFIAARAYGMDFWESAAVTAFGSATWEYFWEDNRASFNDLINTTLGGIALGEMLHRTAWLVRDTRRTGTPRFLRELAGAAIDPLTGFARFTSGDASRVAAKPDALVPTSLAASVVSGVQWEGTTADAIDSRAKVFAEIDLRYGGAFAEKSRAPYDAFTVRVRFGGGGSILSDARVRGRLWAQPIGSGGRSQVSVSQIYDYVANRAYSLSGQGLEIGASRRITASTRGTALLSAWGGVTMLGAVDSRIPPPADAEDEPPAPRTYDYGGGTNFGGAIAWSRARHRVAGVSYQGYQIYVVDGRRANHFMHRVQIDGLLPLAGQFILGSSAEFFRRQTRFQAGGERRDKFTQVRLYLTRSISDGTESAINRPRPADSASATSPRLWVVAGGGSGAAHVGCGPCGTDGAYRRTASVVLDAGARLDPKLNGGVEVAWMPVSLERGEPIWTTFLLGVVQFRPWAGQGLFVKGGMGLGLVRNWDADLDPNRTARQVTTNAMALTYGSGWSFRSERRVAWQVHGLHHVAALGDLTTSRSTIENVVSNYWTVGAGLVIR